MTEADDLPAGLARRHRSWIEAVNETDLGAYAEAVCEDLVWWPPGQPPVEGRAAFRDWLAPFVDRYAYEFSVEDPVFRVSGRWAVEKARFRSRMTPEAGGDAMEHAGRFIALWRRDEDDRWRIERYVDDTVTPDARR